MPTDESSSISFCYIYIYKFLKLQKVTTMGAQTVMNMLRWSYFIKKNHRQSIKQFLTLYSSLSLILSTDEKYRYQSPEPNSSYSLTQIRKFFPLCPVLWCRQLCTDGVALYLNQFLHIQVIHVSRVCNDIDNQTGFALQPHKQEKGRQLCLSSGVVPGNKNQQTLRLQSSAQINTY